MTGLLVSYFVDLYYLRIAVQHSTFEFCSLTVGHCVTVVRYHCNRAVGCAIVIVMPRGVPACGKLG